jgi:PAS domain S-box-containing protein
MNDPENSFRIFDNTGDGVWAVDGNQRVIYWNEAAQRLLGYTEREALGQRCYELLEGRDLGDQPICHARCIKTEYGRANRPIQAFNLRVSDREGQSSWINVSCIVVQGQTDERFGALVHLFRLVKSDGTKVPPLKIRLLGPVVVQRSDNSLVGDGFQQRAKVRALFSLLALNRGQGVSRDEMLSMLWPEMDRQIGLKNMNTTIYYLRHSLEPELEKGADSTYIQNRGERYLLTNGRRNWLDVDVFETNITAAHRETDEERAERLYRKAITLYRGDFLADLDVYQLDCWLERERFQQLYIDALQSLGDLLLIQERGDEAIESYRKILNEDPFCEVVTRKLMNLALQQGENSKALAQYQRFKKHLEREFDVEPRLETRKLYQKARGII